MLWITGQDKRKIQTAIRQMPQVHTSDNKWQLTAQNVREPSHCVINSDSSSNHHASTTRSSEFSPYLTFSKSINRCCCINKYDVLQWVVEMLWRDIHRNLMANE